MSRTFLFFLFFFNDTATTEIYTLSLHDALPIFAVSCPPIDTIGTIGTSCSSAKIGRSTRLNSSHVEISYAVFCLKKKKNKPRRLSYKHSNDLRRSLLSLVVLVET